MLPEATPEEDLTAAPLVLGALLTEEIEDLVPAAVPEDLVAVDDLVVAPALDLVMEELLKGLEADIILVDLHAEASSEKILFARYFSEKVTAVLGTHTHVQTADETIINGCAFITDTGMCGPYDRPYHA